LTFWRWLGVEGPAYDHAYVRISNDGLEWTTVWQNNEEIADTSWSDMNLDISDVADNQPTVYLRWTMGATDSGWRYCGWNIDDIEIFGIHNSRIPGDLDGDGDVDNVDLSFLLADFTGSSGQGKFPEQGDLDGDGDVDAIDLSILLSHFSVQ